VNATVSGGDEVRAIANGRLWLYLPTAESAGFGNVVMIQHVFSDGTFYSLYAHLEEGSVPFERRTGGSGSPIEISRGARIGRVDDTGSSTAPHLHFAIKRTGILGCGYINENCKSEADTGFQNYEDPLQFVQEHQGTQLPFLDDFKRPNDPTVGKGWSEYEPLGGAATIESEALRLTSGSTTGDGVKVFRPIPQQNGLRIGGTVTFGPTFSRLWVLVRADATTSLRTGYGFNWRMDPFDNQLTILDNSGQFTTVVGPGLDDLDLGNRVGINNLPFTVGDTVNFEMLVLTDNTIEVRLWIGARPSAPRLRWAGPYTPVAPGSNCALVESTRDATSGDLTVDDISISVLP